MRTWLLIDTQYLCHRAFHSTGELQFEGRYTGVAFGVLRDLEKYIDLFAPDRTILAFDHRRNFRKELEPTYKSRRGQYSGNRLLTEEELARRAIFYDEIRDLQVDILPRFGFRNIVCVEGYEADDLIAFAADKTPINRESVIIGTDKDLYQCLQSRVSIYNPCTEKTTTIADFQEQWGIDPAQWVTVKALAGCVSDEVDGIEGIGDKTAAAYVGGRLKAGKKFQAIEAGLGIVAKNMPLVRLPFDKKLYFDAPVADEITEWSKNEVYVSLGIREDRRHRHEVAT